jgi:hypothetical protein
MVRRTKVAISMTSTMAVVGVNPPAVLGRWLLVPLLSTMAVVGVNPLAAGQICGIAGEGGKEGFFEGTGSV